MPGLCQRCQEFQKSINAKDKVSRAELQKVRLELRKSKASFKQLKASFEAVLATTGAPAAGPVQSSLKRVHALSNTKASKGQIQGVRAKLRKYEASIKKEAKAYRAYLKKAHAFPNCFVESRYANGDTEHLTAAEVREWIKHILSHFRDI